MNRKDAVKAHVVQFSTLYIFGANYEQMQDGKPVPKAIRDFFNFVTIYFLGLRPKFKSTGTGQPKLKRISKAVQDLWEKILSA